MDNKSNFIETSDESSGNESTLIHRAHSRFEYLPSYLFQASYYDVEFPMVFEMLYESKFSNAEAHIEQLFRKGQQSNSTSTKILAHHAYGNLKIHYMLYDDAIISFDLALELARVSDNHLAIASIGFDYIRVCIILKKWDVAFRTLQEIEHLYQELDLVDEKIYAMIQMSHFHRLLGNVREAQKVLNLARNILSTFSEQASFEHRIEHYFLIKMSQAQLEKKTRNFNKAQEIAASLLQMLDEDNTEAFSDQLKTYYRFTLLQIQAECYLDLHHREKSFSALTHLKRLNENEHDPLIANRYHHFKMAHEFFFESRDPSTDGLLPDLRVYIDTGELEFCLDQCYRILKKCHEIGLLERNEELLNFYQGEIDKIVKTLPEDLLTPFEEYYEFRQGISLKTSNQYLMKKFIDFSRELICESDPDQLAEKALRMISDFCGLKRGFVLLLDSTSPRVAAMLNMSAAELTKETGACHDCLNLAKAVLRNGHGFVQSRDQIQDVSSIKETEKSTLRRIARSEYVILPLMLNGDGLAVIYLDNAVETLHDSVPAEILEDLSSIMASAMSNAYRNSAKDRDLKSARKLLDKHQNELTEHKFSFENFIGISARKRQLFDILQKSLDSTATITLTGESGVGKEMIAKIIHYNGIRKKNSFVALNCAAIPENLLESELFGYVKGAFTDAHDNKDGLFVQADGGTIFLDEIGEMPLSMQVKIIRALQEREIVPIGATKPIRIDVRIICATNRNLEEMVKNGDFREDLYYRIHVVNIPVPSLRERREDIPLLVDHALRMYAIENNVAQKSISSQAMKFMIQYTWPGNVRELINVIYNLSIFVEHDTIELSDLEDRKELFRAPVDIENSQMDPIHFDFNGLSEQIDKQKLTLAEAKHEFERWQILRALQICDNQITSASYHLQMPRPQVSRLAKKYGIRKKSE